MKTAKRESAGDVRPGQDIVIAGYAGLKGSQMIVREQERQLRSRFSEGYLRQIGEGHDQVLGQAVSIFKKLGAIRWEEAGEGGIHTALWNLSGSFGLGFKIDLYRIPVKQETIEICEFYDMDPYDLYCENCFVLVADNGGHMEAGLRQEGIPAAWIGTVTEGVAREVFYGKVHRYMDRPREEPLYKIIERKMLE